MPIKKRASRRPAPQNTRSIKPQEGYQATEERERERETLPFSRINAAASFPMVQVVLQGKQRHATTRRENPTTMEHTIRVYGVWGCAGLVGPGSLGPGRARGPWAPAQRSIRVYCVPSTRRIQQQEGKPIAGGESYSRGDIHIGELYKRQGASDDKRSIIFQELQYVTRGDSDKYTNRDDLAD